MQHQSFPRILRLLAASLCAQLWLSAAHAHLMVQVHGSAQLDADIVRSSDGTELTVRGRLRDELAEGIASGKLRFEVGQGNQPTSPLSNARNCVERASTGASRQDAGIETDAEGHFCARLVRDQLPAGTTLRVVFDGTEAYSSATATLTPQDDRAGLVVEFGQLSHSVSLDASELSFVAELQPISPSVVRDSALLTLLLSLRSADQGTSEQRQIRQLQAIVGTPTHVSIPIAELGRPGPAELCIGFEGSPTYKPFRDQYRIERTTLVRLRVIDWPESAIKGDRLALTVQTRSGARFPAPGFVEILGFDGNRSLFPLQADGSAKVVVLTPRIPKSDSVSIRYQSKAAGWRSEEPQRLSLRLLPPSRWNFVGWIAAALVVLLWLAWSRRRAEPGVATASPAATPRPYAHLEVIESASDPNAGWSGIVVDAHEGTAIGQATVELHRPAFDRQELLLTALSDQFGQFEIPSHRIEPGAACRLELGAVGYARLGLVLPPPGRFKVHLVSVRRAVLERLVAWTKRRG
jgi:hypothetical protein